MSHVRGDVSKCQVGRLSYLAFVHVLQPGVITALDVSAAPQLLFQFGTLRDTYAVQSWQDLVREAGRHVGDVVERIGEWRGRELVVLGKRSSKDTVSQFIRVGNDDAGIPSARVVDSQDDWCSFCDEQCQYTPTGWVWVPMGSIVQVISATPRHRVEIDILIHGISLGSSAIKVSQIKIDSKFLQAIGDITPIRGVESGV